MDISICIVTANARSFLRDCLNSIVEFPPHGDYEIIVVDNASNDGTVSMLTGEFPHVKTIFNESNRGFTIPLNQALKAAKGDWLVLLNPDTLLTSEVFSVLQNFMESNPDVGVAAPKVMNRDGSFQKQCRRGEARPLEVFGYFMKLDHLFPRNKRLTGYLQGWMNEDEVAEVKAVSGSCMMIRREALEQVGYFDEQFYAYQEDSDFCFQVRKHGWKVFYVPTAEIIHYGGEGGSGTRPYFNVYQWHKSYYLYYKKNLAKDYFFLFNWFYYVVMGLKLTWAMVLTVFRKKKIVGTPKA